MIWEDEQLEVVRERYQRGGLHGERVLKLTQVSFTSWTEYSAVPVLLKLHEVGREGLLWFSPCWTIPLALNSQHEETLLTMGVFIPHSQVRAALDPGCHAHNKGSPSLLWRRCDIMTFSTDWHLFWALNCFEHVTYNNYSTLKTVLWVRHLLSPFQQGNEGTTKKAPLLLQMEPEFAPQLQSFPS